MKYLSTFIIFVIPLLVRSDSSEDGICNKTIWFNGTLYNVLASTDWNSIQDDNSYRYDISAMKSCYASIRLSTVGGITLRFNKTEQYCCPGYEEIEKDPLRCSLVCNPNCHHGTCVRPGTCKCNEGYVLANHSAHYCVPSCNNDCVNGHCAGPGSCHCKEGFRPETESVCVPMCENGCEYGECTAPNVCKCFEGYHNSHNGSCTLPACNSKCTLPNYCDCSPNAVKVHETCEDICTENRTTDCWRASQTIQKQTLHTNNNYEVISIQDGHYAFTMDTSCQNFAYNFVDDITTFACLTTNKTGEGINTVCQSGNYNSGCYKPKMLQARHGMFDYDPSYDELVPLSVDVTFTFLFPKRNESQENCDLCFCNSFNMQINSRESTIVHLCACRYDSKTEGFEDSVQITTQTKNDEDFCGLIYIIILIIVLVSILVMSGIVLYHFVRKRFYAVQASENNAETCTTAEMKTLM